MKNPIRWATQANRRRKIRRSAAAITERLITALKPAQDPPEEVPTLHPDFVGLDLQPLADAGDRAALKLCFRDGMPTNEQLADRCRAAEITVEQAILAIFCRDMMEAGHA